MEKKNNTMLLVIAVVTLLVTVVGATFAYYSVTSANNTSSRTNMVTTTEKVGVVSLQTETENLYLKLNADQMADTVSAKGTYYHRTTNDFATKVEPASATSALMPLTGFAQL